MSKSNDEKQPLNNLPDLSKYMENNYLPLMIVTGCLIAGLAVYIYLKQQQSSKNIPSGKFSPPQKNSQTVSPVSLCLVVPASVLGGNIREKYPIDISDLEKLIDNSAYFLCIEPAQADMIQNQLELTEENMTNVSEQREVYIRINIDDAPGIMGKKVPYILKRNLPANGQCVVRKIACLKYLSVSGLENFNRII
ncbi:hypothetical protein [Anabaena sp. FACHB-1237]|uniref:hypothetical protein n=1 Tax=Anabaena sp. FACHB-1237 TaxID=2692769 RepID=UPI001680031F|nr:hypothetical protein [Anabaena sp. FACHB-1237]